MESIQNYYMRFRQQYNELIDVVQDEQSNRTSPRLDLQIEKNQQSRNIS